MQYILELAKHLDYDPRACVDSFFSKIQVADVEYKKSFDDELKQFKERIKRRAAEKIDEAVKVSIAPILTSILYKTFLFLMCLGS